MDLSIDPSQQNITWKRGQCKGLDYSNLTSLEPRDIVLQFTHARGKKTNQCVSHGQCRGFGDHNSIP